MTPRIRILIIILVAILLGIFVSTSTFNNLADEINTRLSLEGTSFEVPHTRAFRLGLDLQGGTHLVYEGDLSTVTDRDPKEAMEGVRDVIERRVNLFGVAEPTVQLEGENRLIVELAGVTDIQEAIDTIGLTPFLEFREPKPEEEVQALFALASSNPDFILREEDIFVPTGITGQHLKRSTLTFDPTTGEPQVALELTDEGAELFSELTGRLLGQIIAIFLDGEVISAPVVNSQITGGSAFISGSFTPEEARELVTRLNAGALPVAIDLVSQQTVGATLGAKSLQKSLRAGIFGLVAVAIFMVFYYRLPGLLAIGALAVYVVLVLSIYKLVPVTLTLAGLAGFILSLGMAVDANILIFARMREELADGRKLNQAINNGFSRAWFSIRDGHITTLLGAVVLFLFATSIVKGFALTLGIGVVVSLFTAVVVTRAFLNTVSGANYEDKKWMF